MFVRIFDASPSVVIAVGLYAECPRCEGRPDGPCPAKKNDSTVRSTQSNLFLGPACDEYSFRTNVEARSSSQKPSGQRTSHELWPEKGWQHGDCCWTRWSCCGDRFDIGSCSSCQRIIIVLCYYRNSCNQVAIAGIVCSYYTPVEITAAMKFLIACQFHGSLSDTSFVTERRSSRVYISASSWSCVVCCNWLCSSAEVRSGRNRCFSIADRQAVLNATVTQLATTVEAVGQPTGQDIISESEELQVKVDSFSTLLRGPARTLTHKLTQLQVAMLIDHIMSSFLACKRTVTPTVGEMLVWRWLPGGQFTSQMQFAWTWVASVITSTGRSLSNCHLSGIDAWSWVGHTSCATVMNLNKFSLKQINLLTFADGKPLRG